MNRILSRSTLSLTLGMFLCAGCRHAPTTIPVTEVQAPIPKNVSRITIDPGEQRLQRQIDEMQEQIGILSAQTEALARAHGGQMGAKWIEKVQAVRAEGSRSSERLRYLEATRTLLARKLEALRSEIKVYEEFQSSDPAIPRR